MGAAAQHGGAAGGVGQRAAPEHRLLQLAVERDELEFGVGGERGRIHARGQLDGQGRRAGAPGQDPAQGRLVRLDAEAALPPGAPARVAEQGRGLGRLLGQQVALQPDDALGQAEGGSVGLGHRQAQRVTIDRGNPGARGGQGQGIAADATAEVGNVAGGREAGSTVGGHRGGAGLLQGLTGEVELVRGGELALRAAAQQDQFQGGARLRGADLTAQALKLAQRIGLREGPGGQFGEQRLTCRRQQPAEGFEVHDRLCSSARAAEAACANLVRLRVVLRRRWRISRQPGP